jgi:uncharacterized protein YeaO (DUF488 family)
MIKLKRIYQEPSPKDGLRADLVERLWPRFNQGTCGRGFVAEGRGPEPGLSKWWFGHDPVRWEQFQEGHRQKLREKKEAVQLLKQKGKEGTVTLVYAARDEDHNGALVLKRLLQDH